MWGLLQVPQGLACPECCLGGPGRVGASAHPTCTSHHEYFVLGWLTQEVRAGLTEALCRRGQLKLGM